MKIGSFRVKRSMLINGVRYGHGDEDALNELLNDDQKKALADSGVVTLIAEKSAKKEKKNDAKRDTESVEA